MSGHLDLTPEEFIAEIEKPVARVKVRQSRRNACEEASCPRQRLQYAGSREASAREEVGAMSEMMAINHLVGVLSAIGKRKGGR